MLRKIRIILAAVMFIGITLLFLDFTGTMHHWVAWMPKLQFLEAVLALNVVVIVVLHCADTGLRTYLLLGHLSLRCDARYHWVVGKETEEEPLQLLESHELAALYHVRNIWYRTGAVLLCRHRHRRTAAGTLLCLRTHSHQPVTTCLSGR